jgi:23S rRNA A1618 N6-methylase RlmF
MGSAAYTKVDVVKESMSAAMNVFMVNANLVRRIRLVVNSNVASIVGCL